MDGILSTLTSLFGAMFVLGTMASMGLAFRVSQITTPLKDVSLDMRALLANFVIFPLLAFLVVRFLGLKPDHAVAIAILALCAGGPALPKYIDIIKGDRAGSVAVMFLLVVGTIIFMPLILPLILNGVEVDAAKIAKSLIASLLIPLGIALLIRARYPELAERWEPTATQISNIGLAGSIILSLIQYFPQVIALFGTGTLLALTAIILLGYGAGLLLGRKDHAGERQLLGFATGQRNVSAAIVVATSAFADSPDVYLVCLIAGVVMNIILIFIASETAKKMGNPGGDKESEAPVKG